MKNTKVLLILLLGIISCRESKNNTYNVGQQSITYIDETRNRPLPTEIWYPTLDRLPNTSPNTENKPLFKTIPTIPNARMEHGKFPLLIISHGTGGSRFSLTWFIEKMVKEGYVVVSLDHYGNSTFNKIPREFVKWWERSIDVQYVLTQVLEDPRIGTQIDTSKIGGVGFSLGGYTNIALAGGYVDRSMPENGNDEGRALPAEFPKTDEVIDFENDSLIVASYQQYKDLVKDERLKAFFVMAPAVGFGFHSKAQTAKITAPVYIVAGKGDTVVPVKSNAEKFDRLIDTSTLHLYNAQVGHYVFLNEATEFGKEMMPAIAVDHVAVNRKNIHEETLQLAINFFKNTL
ncbi:dienelactone hydrolase [Kriegella sp. EG-1]|nr:dienelactone hydrolase [Flavobacteriaceae bacterium EG-1]